MNTLYWNLQLQYVLALHILYLSSTLPLFLCSYTGIQIIDVHFQYLDKIYLNQNDAQGHILSGSNIGTKELNLSGQSTTKGIDIYIMAYFSINIFPSFSLNKTYISCYSYSYILYMLYILQLIFIYLAVLLQYF